MAGAPLKHNRKISQLPSAAPMSYDMMSYSWIPVAEFNPADSTYSNKKINAATIINQAASAAANEILSSSGWDTRIVDIVNDAVADVADGWVTKTDYAYEAIVKLNDPVSYTESAIYQGLQGKFVTHPEIAIQNLD